jgi:hypothetical protein
MGSKMKFSLTGTTSKIFIIAGLALLISTGSGRAQVNNQPVNLKAAENYQSYAGLSELVTMICDDAIYKLQGFFGPSVVKVTPFITFGSFQKNKISSLGISLADQMIAAVNNDTVLNAEDTPTNSNEYLQKLRGTLQEVDGYLRIHISAANVYGERMSYTTNVEMSEPIYRALHTYL